MIMEPRSSMIYHLQTGKSGNPVVEYSLGSERGEPGAPMPCPRAGEYGHYSSSRRSKFSLPLPFSSIQVLSGLGYSEHLNDSLRKFILKDTENLTISNKNWNHQAFKKIWNQPGMVAHTFNPSPWEA